MSVAVSRLMFRVSMFCASFVVVLWCSHVSVKCMERIITRVIDLLQVR